VLIHLGYTPTEDRELFDAASAFMGGTLFMGKTCSAFTAGVMAIGLKVGEIENSYPRVIRLLAIMTAGGNAFDERINKFNRSMNPTGYQNKFTSVHVLVPYDHAVRIFQHGWRVNYIEGNRIANCRTIVAGSRKSRKCSLSKQAKRKERSHERVLSDQCGPEESGLACAVLIWGGGWHTADRGLFGDR
jgi:hypothetical protein